MFLSDHPASAGERRFAAVAAGVSIVLFVAIAPLATLQLAPVPSFIPIYQSALVINDLVTAIFLLGQFHIARSKALLLLACAYMFTALMAVAHALTFPGLFSPAGLLGAGPQTTAWLYIFWHGGFPLLVIAYARCADRGQTWRQPAIFFSMGAVVVAVSALTLMATLGHDLLPPIMQGNHYTPVMIAVVSSTWALSVIALLMLLRRRSGSVLDLWLAVVMCAWVFDIALSGVFNAGRYDLGFYAGRIFGLLAASFVLIMLLLESSKLYVQVIQLRDSDRKKATELHRLSVVDPLTGIANRRGFEQALDEEWRRTMRHNTGLSLVMIDVDYFKRFNDTYGHPAGDECLRAVAQALAGKARRAGEVAARYGGEEFAVLLPHTEIAAAHELAEHICEAVRELSIPHAGSEVAPYVTISVGVASAAWVTGGAHTWAREDARNETLRLEPTVLLKAADQALYQAKAAGRNRVVSAYGNDIADKASKRPPAHHAA